MPVLRNVSLAVALMLSGGCNAAFWGNVGVLGITVGIFLGTVFLTRDGESSNATRSSASSTRS